MLTLYWYPKCSTCRKAKAWLEQNQIEFKTHDMISEPPSATTLEGWLTQSDLPVRRFFNTSGQKYRELNLKEQVPNLTVSQASSILASDGMLIKRPLLVKDDQVLAVGFNENNYEGALKNNGKEMFKNKK